MAFVTKDIEVEVEVDFDAVKDYIQWDATEKEKRQIIDLLKADICGYHVKTIADEMKYKFLMDNFDKFTLEELEEKFNEIYIP